jgi:UbiD family decarboxylase
VIKCRTVDLEVPADSELVLEGRIRPGIRVKDGPYMDYAGVPSVNPRAYLFELTAIMRRQSPIFRGMAVGRPGAEDHQLFALLSQMGLVDFHGSRIRQLMQNALLRRRLFRLFQWTGRFGRLKMRLMGKRGDALCE